MPITLDPSLPPSLYPLAWIVGSWEGSGAMHSPSTDGGAPMERRVEQHLQCTPREDGTLAWHSRIHLIDEPAPLPPTSAFARDERPAEQTHGTGQRSLLMREEGTWTLGDPLPGQDLEAARTARPGAPEATISYALHAAFERDGETLEWAGEVRGPRIQLAQRDQDARSEPSALARRPAVVGTRMFGYVGGRLMWLWERRESAGAELAPYLSVELNRV